MVTAVVVSTRGFGIFRFDLLERPDQVRFVGIFSAAEPVNLSPSQRERFDAVHVVPCGMADPSPMLASLVDLEAARAVLRELLAHTPAADVSLHCYDEQNMLVAARLRSEFGLRGPKYDDILPFRDKCVMKERLVAAGIRVPRFGRYDPAAFARDPAAYFARIAAEVGTPFILKPIDSAGSDGVHKIGSAGEFAALPGDFGRGYEYEEFITGTMYSVNIVSHGRRAIFGGVTEYLVNSFDVQAGKVNVDINLIESDPRVPRMLRFAEAALDALGWPDGASHLELFHTERDELVFLEVAARFKGMAGLAAMERNYGIAFVNLAFEVETGLRSRPYDRQQAYCFDGVIPMQRGAVSRLVEPQIESQVELTWKVAPGDVIGRQTDSLLANAGTFLVWNADYEALYRDFKRFAGYVPIVYHEPVPAG